MRFANPALPNPDVTRAMSHSAKVERGGVWDSLLLAAVPSFFIAMAVFATRDDLRHWFLIPLALYGTIVGSDLISWLRGRLEVYDPIGLVSLWAVKSAWAPLVQVASGRLDDLAGQEADWPFWAGCMSLLNLLGYLVYRLVTAFVANRRPATLVSTAWPVGRLMNMVLGCALVVSLLVQVVIFISFGGISGYVHAFETRTGGFGGMGIVFMISEAFPILTLMWWAIRLAKHGLTPSWMHVFLLLLAFFVVQIVFGGLRGSRSNTIWAMIWAVGIVHFWIRPIPRKLMICGVLGVIPFVYFYGFYKKHGSEGFVKAVVSSEARRELTQSGSGEGPWYGRIVGSGTQTVTLFKICEPDSDFELAWGRTYVGAAAKLVPRFIWPSRPVGKKKEGTEVLHGKGSYPEQEASQVWGLGGEALLNFGPLGVPFAFIVPGVLAGWIRRVPAACYRFDTRLLLQPFLVCLLVAVMFGDSDNVVFFCMKNGALPFLVVYLGSAKRKVPVVSPRVNTALAPRH